MSFLITASGPVAGRTRGFGIAVKDWSPFLRLLIPKRVIYTDVTEAMWLIS